MCHLDSFTFRKCNFVLAIGSELTQTSEYLEVNEYILRLCKTAVGQWYMELITALIVLIVSPLIYNFGAYDDSLTLTYETTH